jgi:hypothetical protein
MRNDHRMRSTPPARGSALLMVTVLLAVLAVIGVAAVSLGSQERINASAKGTRDRMAACANAARLTIWAELARYGSANIRGPLAERPVTLSNGTILSAPSHYAQDPTQLIEIRRFTAPLASASAAADNLTNLTNIIVRSEAGLGSGTTTAYTFVARCRDRDGREVEVEFTTGLMF